MVVSGLQLTIIVVVTVMSALTVATTVYLVVVEVSLVQSWLARVSSSKNATSSATTLAATTTAGTTTPGETTTPGTTPGARDLVPCGSDSSSGSTFTVYATVPPSGLGSFQSITYCSGNIVSGSTQAKWNSIVTAIRNCAASSGTLFWVGVQESSGSYMWFRDSSAIDTYVTWNPSVPALGNDVAAGVDSSGNGYLKAVSYGTVVNHVVCFS